MNKLRMHSLNKVNENIERVGGLFPNCLTERKNDNGELERAIDFDMLRQELSSVIVEGNEERYQFTWPDKKKSILLANAPIAKTLRPCPEESVDFDTTENLYIEGDNLDVLKLLQETYLGKVKMIYIDPPYNTGNDFVYEDDFSQSTDEYLANSGQFDEDGNRLVQNNESNGRFHTDWLNMIYPRIKVSKDLLSSDGVIFISIDDNEIENLKKICNEVFGENNFVSNMIWQSRTSISNDHEVSTNHNHTLIYSKDRETLDFGGDVIDVNDYINPDNDPRGPWKLVPIDANHIGGATFYPIKNPKTGVDYYPPNGRIWCYNKITIQKLIEEGRIKFGLNDDSSPKRKLYYNERMEKGDRKTPSSLIIDAGTTKEGTTTIMDLFDKQKLFDYPKSVKLIHKLISYGSFQKTGLILDFFSGSATTAHAVMQLNAEDGGNRKFIMVQLPEITYDGKKEKHKDEKGEERERYVIDEKTGYPIISKDSDARKAGFWTIPQIGKERIRRAGMKILEEQKAKSKDLFTKETKKLDIGFRVLKLDTTNMKDIYYNPSEYTPELFNTITDNIKEDRTPKDLLFQVMLELGILLSSKIEESEIDGKKVFNVADGFLIACFDNNVNDVTVKAIAQKKPYYAVFRDSSIATDSVATNFEQIFATYSPTTERKVL